MAWRPSSAVQRPDPVDPRAVALAEHPVDQAVVGGQVVLGQEADLERGLGHAREARLVRGPRVLVEVAAEPVRDELVGEPLLGDPGVTVVQAPSLGLEFMEQDLVLTERLVGRELGVGVEAAFELGHRSPTVGRGQA